MFNFNIISCDKEHNAELRERNTLWNTLNEVILIEIQRIFELAGKR